MRSKPSREKPTSSGFICYPAQMLRTALVLLSSLSTALVLRQDPATEPPLLVRVHLDGKEHILSDGGELVLDLGGKETKLKVAVEPLKQFQAAGVEFAFPRDMAFEYDAEEPESWTLDGNNVVLHLHRHKTGNPRAMARSTLTSMLSMLDEDAKRPVRREVSLGGKKYDGLVGRVQVGPAVLQVTAVGLEIGEQTLVVMVQDNLDVDQETAECKRIFELLDRTLKITGK